MATGGEVASSSDENIEYPCSVCEKKKILSDSGHYCLMCKDFYCVNCLQRHNESTPDHKVLAVSENEFKKVITERCVNHPNEVIKHYCRYHDAFLCNICERQDHRTCTDVKQISEEADDLIAEHNLQVVPGQLKSTLKRVNQVMDSIKICLENEQQNEHTDLKYLLDYEQKVIAKIRKLAEEGRNNITNAKNKLVSEAKEHRDDCVKANTLINTYIKKVDRSKHRKAHSFILKKKGQGILKRAEDICTESENMIKNRSFGLRPNTQIAGNLNAFPSLVTEVKLYTIGQRTDMNLKISVDEEDCNISDICRLGDGTLVLSDLGNKRLTWVDPSTNKVIDHCKMKETPRGLCSLGPQVVAVADWSHIVHIISAVTGERLTLRRHVDMGQEASRLACRGEELFAGCGASLRIHDMSGKIIMDISRIIKDINSDTDGQSMFSGITGIVVNQARDRVFVTDLCKGLVCMTLDHRVVFRLSDDVMRLVGAWGVTTDHRGCVMVAGALSNNVVQVTDEGRVVGEILSMEDGIWRPRCLYYDVDGRKLYVGGETSQLLGFELL